LGGKSGKKTDKCAHFVTLKKKWSPLTLKPQGSTEAEANLETGHGGEEEKKEKSFSPVKVMGVTSQK